ncbi:MAG TPA: hypothetical protein PLN21_07785 [Gemmatales bacterium]|nr:hypothetical protein [Gemmatales bacterium]
MSEVSQRQVKIAYIVPRDLKKKGLTLENFTAKLAEFTAEVENFSDAELDHHVVFEDGEPIHQHRLTMIKASTFACKIVKLERCSVWPEMGKRKWLRGMIPTAEKLIQNKAAKDDPLFDMVEYARRGLYDSIPLILFPRASNNEQFRIDDGNHRALSRFIAGATDALAYVGSIEKKLNHCWPIS